MAYPSDHLTREVVGRSSLLATDTSPVIGGGGHINGGAPSFSHGLVVYTHTSECGIDIARENGSNASRLRRPC